MLPQFIEVCYFDQNQSYAASGILTVNERLLSARSGHSHTSAILGRTMPAMSASPRSTASACANPTEKRRSRTTSAMLTSPSPPPGGAMSPSGLVTSSLAESGSRPPRTSEPSSSPPPSLSGSSGDVPIATSVAVDSPSPSGSLAPSRWSGHGQHRLH